MLFSVGMLVLIVLSLPVLLVLSLRRWGLEQSETESRLRSPETHTVSYLVPEGQDPTFVRAALTHGGFESVMDRTNVQLLLVRCEPGDRDRVREIIEHVYRSDFTGHSLPGSHVHFEDDPS